jgi:hypothetical protein
MPYRLLVLALSSVALLTCSSDGSSPIAPGVTVGNVRLPVSGAVYRGTDPHLFLDQQVTLFCGTHGTFSNAVTPPQTVGATVLSEYTATFVGELTLEPPVVPSAVTHALSVQARMAESITLVETSGGAFTFDTELVTFELQGTDMPDNIQVRESPDLVSAGATSVTPLSGGQNRVSAYYDVWLDISLDGGRSWNPAAQAVRMTLEPT